MFFHKFAALCSAERSELPQLNQLPQQFSARMTMVGHVEVAEKTAAKMIGITSSQRRYCINKVVWENSQLQVEIPNPQTWIMMVVLTSTGFKR